MIDPKNCAEIMKQAPIFRDFNETECRQLWEIATEETYQPGQTIIEQDAIGGTLWIMLEGKATVTRRREKPAGGEPIVLAELEPMNHFGEMSFFHRAGHSATVRATTPVKVLRIDHRDYDELIRDGARSAFKLAYNVLLSLSDRLRHMDAWIAELSDQPETSRPK